MDCSAEEQLVRMRLQDVTGALEVHVDLDERTVAVVHTGEVGPIADALDELNLGSQAIPERDDVAPTAVDAPRERRALRIALGINAVFFVGELSAGFVSRSLGLVADSLDMLADASVYALSLAAVGHVVARQKRLAAASGYLQLALAVVGLSEVVRRLITGGELPDTHTMVVVAALALLANLVTLLVLRRARSDAAHFQASWIFTANDIKVNALVIVAAVLVSLSGSALPDLVAGAAIFAVVANGARRILVLSR
jgi:Co/Zn/Cd efflux system component